ncbi:MAG: PrgI family mobile element protein, partial [Ruminococcus sp.]
WLCIVAAAPIAVAGFWGYNGMNFEEFIGAWFRSEFLAAGMRKFERTNYLYEIVKEELDNGNMGSVRKKKPNKKAKAEDCKDGTAVHSD